MCHGGKVRSKNSWRWYITGNLLFYKYLFRGRTRIWKLLYSLPLWIESLNNFQFVWVWWWKPEQRLLTHTYSVIRHHASTDAKVLYPGFSTSWWLPRRHNTRTVAPFPSARRVCTGRCWTAGTLTLTNDGMGSSHFARKSWLWRRWKGGGENSQ